MERRVGIRFVEAGPIAYCATGPLDLGIGDYVVVTTDLGERLGWVVVAAADAPPRGDGPVRVVSRLASEDDVAAWQGQRARAQEAFAEAQAAAVRVEQRVRVATIDFDLAGRRAEVTFTAREGENADRVADVLARTLRAEVRARQVGDRDRAKALGGLGQCGRGLCCSTWMVEFPAISVKMAKDQGLAPNPSKISGVCGRLLCCLAFEVEAYREIVGTLPKVGKRITTPVGRAKVLSINALTEIVRLRLDDTGEVIEINATALRQQMGTAIRPEELEGEVEESIRQQDEERRAQFLAALEPVGAPRRRSAGAGSGLSDARPLRDLTETDLPAREPRTERAPRPGDGTRAPRSGGGSDRRGRGASEGERGQRRPRPARDGAPASENGERLTSSGIRITRRRAGQPASGASDPGGPESQGTPRSSQSRGSQPRGAQPRGTQPRGAQPRGAQPSARRSPGAPGAPPDTDAGSTGNEAEAERRRRRRGRRGGRGRGGAGGAAGDAGGTPPQD